MPITLDPPMTYLSSSQTNTPGAIETTYHPWRSVMARLQLLNYFYFILPPSTSHVWLDITKLQLALPCISPQADFESIIGLYLILPALAFHQPCLSPKVISGYTHLRTYISRPQEHRRKRIIYYPSFIDISFKVHFTLGCTAAS